MRTFRQKDIGDKYFSSIFNNLAVLVFYSKLQLIQNFLTNGMAPPPRAALQI
jgi:hypothetical protein